jgi:uncharacterized coiled-coil DUF342 family protein
MMQRDGRPVAYSPERVRALVVQARELQARVDRAALAFEHNAEIADLRAEVADLRAEFAKLRAEVAEICEVGQLLVACERQRTESDLDALRHKLEAALATLTRRRLGALLH